MGYTVFGCQITKIKAGTGATGIFLLCLTRFLLYKNNEAQIWPKIKNKLRTIQAGIWNNKCKFTFFLNKILLLSSNSILSSVKILQTLRSIEFPLRFIRLDDHKLGHYIWNILGVISYCCCILKNTEEQLKNN